MEQIQKPELTNEEKGKVEKLLQLLFSEDRFFTKSEITEHLMLDGTKGTIERKTRMLIKLASNYFIILSTAKTAGYKVYRGSAYDNEILEQMTAEYLNRVDKLLCTIKNYEAIKKTFTQTE